MKHGERNIYRRLIDLLRLHQQRSKFIGSAYGSKLSVLESFILVELDVDSSRSATVLAGILNVEKNMASRAIKRLVQSGYLISRTSQEDRRAKSLKVTAKGQRFLAEHDRFNAVQLAELTGNLSGGELGDLQHYFRVLADGCGAAPATLRPNENPLLVEMRRLSRTFRIFGANIVGTTYSPLEWQIMSEIAFSSAGVRGKELTEMLTVPANTISQLLTRFEERGMLRRTADSADRRSRKLTLTPLGTRELEKIESSGEAMLRRGLSSLDDRQIRGFIDVFAKYLGLGSAAEEGVFREQIRLSALQSEEQRCAARGFLVSWYLRLNQLNHMPEILVAQSSVNYALYQGSAIVGVAEFRPRTRGGLVLTNFAVAADFDAPAFLFSWLRAAAQRAKCDYPAAKVLVSVQSAAFAAAQKIPGTSVCGRDAIELPLPFLTGRG